LSLNSGAVDNFKFAQHVLACQIGNFDRCVEWDDTPETCGVPVPYDSFIKEHFRNSDWRLMQSAGYLTGSGYSKEKGYCREYSVTDKLLEEFWKFNTYKPGNPIVRVNSLTGRAASQR
jgi:hypothetical protein